MPLNGKRPNGEDMIVEFLTIFCDLFNCDDFVKHFRAICFMHLSFRRKVIKIKMKGYVIPVVYIEIYPESMESLIQCLSS